MNELTAAPTDLSAPASLPRWLVVAAVVILAGGAAFFAGVAGLAPARAWQSYLVNLLYFTGLAQAAATFLAILTLTRSRWGWPFERIATGMAAFLPVSFLLFLLLPAGRHHLFPWVLQPVPEKAMWLNFTFLVVRDGLGLILLMSLTLALVYHRLRPLAAQMRGSAGDWREGVYRLLTHRFGEFEHELARCQARIPPLAIALAAAYALVFSLLAGDLIMSLDPHWYSSLFGAYNFMISLYMGVAALAILAIRERERGRFQLPTDRLHDLGKLLFALALVGGDFFWSQFLVIWYGNIPEETTFIEVRIHQDPWATLSWVVLIGLFVLPFLALLARAPKRNPRALTAIAGLVLAVGWLERYMLVVPSLTAPEQAQVGPLELLITLAFAAAFLTVYRLVLYVFPPEVRLPHPHMATGPGRTAA